MSLLLHPYYLLALALLLLNDHVLKIVYPSFVTGKLSDFAGVFLIVIYLFVMFRIRKRVRTGVVIISVLVGGVFALIQLVPVDLWYTPISNYIPIPKPYITPDPTDIWALAVLPLGHLFIKKYRNMKSDVSSRNILHCIWCYIIIGISTFAILATSPALRTYKAGIHREIETFTNEAEALFLFEETLEENGIAVRQRTIDETNKHRYWYTIVLKHEVSDSTINHTSRYYTSGRISVEFHLSTSQVVLDSIFLAGRRDTFDDQSVNDLIQNWIVNPFENKIRERN